MKQLLLLSCILILFACVHKKVETQFGVKQPATVIERPYPQYVQNPNTKKWAVITGEDKYFGSMDATTQVSMYNPHYSTERRVVIAIYDKIDACEFAPLGAEYTFKDSAEAVKVYVNYQMTDYTSEYQTKKRKKEADSLFNVYHSYKHK